MLRALHDLGHRALLYQQAFFHDRHTIGKAAHQIQVVGNHQHGHAGLALQISQQIQNLPPQRHIQRCGGLVGQQQTRTAGQRHGNHGALPLAAAELVGKALRTALGLGNAGGSQQLHRLLARLRFAQRLLELQHLRHLIAHHHQRVQRRHRLLKNHGDVVATHRLHLTL